MIGRTLVVRDWVGSFCNYKAPKFLTLFGLDLISRINAIQTLILSSRSIMYELSHECMLASLQLFSLCPQAYDGKALNEWVVFQFTWFLPYLYNWFGLVLLHCKSQWKSSDPEWQSIVVWYGKTIEADCWGFDVSFRYLWLQIEAKRGVCLP